MYRKNNSNINGKDNNNNRIIIRRTREVPAIRITSEHVSIYLSIYLSTYLSIINTSTTMTFRDEIGMKF